MPVRHGVTISREANIPRPIADVSLSVIALIGTAKAGSALNYVPQTIRSQQAANALFGDDLEDTAAMGGDNTLPRAISDIYAQGSAVCVVAKQPYDTDYATTATAMATGGFDAASQQYIGKDAFLGFRQASGLRPGILIAPEWTHRPYASLGVANGMATGIAGVASQLRSISVVDGIPNSAAAFATVAELRVAAGDAGPRGLYLWPWLKRTGRDAVAPSAAYAGHMARVDAEAGGPWMSPSNQLIFGLTGTQYPVPYEPQDMDALANTLNGGDANATGYVTTFIEVGGFRSWGNRLAAPTEPAYGFTSVARVADMIEDAIARSFLWAVDMNITRDLVDAVTETVNEYLRSLAERDAIDGGESYPSPTLNTNASVIAGKFYVSVRYSSLYPAEEIAFNIELTDDYISVFREEN